MKTLMTIVIALLVAPASGGCRTDTDLTSSRFACEASHGCPDGFLCCGDGFCRASCQMGDSDTDVDTDTDTDTDTSFECNDTTCVDPTTGLEWEQHAQSSTAISYEEAQTYCNGIGMRLPNVDELRTIVRGCPRMESGGACGITDTCGADCDSQACTSICGFNGPGDEGHYYAPGLTGAPYSFSSTQYYDTEGYWVLNFISAFLSGELNSLVRCVR